MAKRADHLLAQIEQDVLDESKPLARGCGHDPGAASEVLTDGVHGPIPCIDRPM